MMRNFKSILFNLIFACILSLNTTDLFSRSFFSGDNIKTACINYVYSIINDEIEIKVTDKIPNQNFEEDKVYARFQGDRNSLKGNTHIIVEFLKDEKILKRITVPVNIKVYKKLPVAVRNIFSGKQIKNGDFELKKIDATNLNSEDLVGEDEIIGAIAKRNITKDNVILKSFIQSGNQINRGQKVEINVISGAVRIRTTGTALQDGLAGSEIRVRKDDSNVILNGVVSEEGTVVINLSENK
ncbi:MAG: flagellar basal body P-ring formation chaperone FlgA [Candidatus Kapabacteria bacterium]|nr:flagellar basal body P-ring formation chaperone FlgA [Candidatus Kapabacteria bacterium]